MVKVKICGITNEKDVFHATESGADFLGFIVGIKNSKENLTKADAKELIKKLPIEVIPVMVTELTKSNEIIELIKAINPVIVQLHNDIEINEIKKIKRVCPKIRLTKAIHVEEEREDNAIKSAKLYERYVDFLLIDTKIKSRIGGTGKTHNWEISKKIVRNCKKPVFLAGGLTPENIVSAIATVKPYGVDVNSGVRSVPRFKDYNKMRIFIERAKLYNFS